MLYVPPAPLRILAAAVVAGLLGCLAAWPSAAPAALRDALGEEIPNTGWNGSQAQLAGGPSCATAGPDCRLFAEPGSPEDDDPAAVAALGSSFAPEDDLLAALRRMAAAGDAGQAAAARDHALAILEGEPLPGRAWSGIPLLNWNPAAKVRRVPAGGEVTVTQVRTPAHTYSDAWLLDFEDPSRPYSVRYRITELGGTFGSALAPVPLLADGERPLGGVPSALVPLAAPALITSTHDWSRFTRTRGLPAPGAAETTRLATRELVVRMPPPRLTRAVLHPSEGSHGPSLHTLAPATAARLDRAAEVSATPAGATATEAERERAIERLAEASPERQLWSDLRGLPAADDSGFIAAARALGEQDAPLVGAMRTRDGLPDGVVPDPDADVTVVLQNNEAYLSASRVRPGRVLRVQMVNRDGFAHRFSLTELHGRQAVLGAEDWGRFDWTPLGEPVPVAPGESRTVERALPGGAFAVVLGDEDAGDQATAVVELDTGPRIDSVRLGTTDSSAPLHAAFDAGGALWVSLTGSDEIVRLEPGADLAASPRTTVRLPGGAHTPVSPRSPLEPADVAVDARGIVWTTLVLGNAIARIDPAQIRHQSGDGVRLYPLPPCGEDECAVPFPPTPGETASREPLQMEVTEDQEGNSVIWFTEAAAGRIGALRVAPDGRRLGLTEFSCGCATPLGLALDEAGDVWFTEAVENRLGRLTPGVTEPFSAGAARLRHHVIPSAVATVEPDVSRVELMTSLPHSVAVDARGRVWATESATGKLAVLDPARARPGTSEGFTEIDLPRNDFKGPAVPADLAVDRAGKVFWTDEYGDAVGTVDATAGAPSDWSAGRSLRPVTRRSLTDSPVLSTGGDLWFIESGANLLVRVSGASAGAPGPAPAPEIALDTADGSLTATGLREVKTLGVQVLRGGAVVARAEAVPVSDGEARVGTGDWNDGAARLEPGDTVRVTRAGDHPRAVLEHVLPALSARRGADGAIAGSARRGGAPLAGRVTFPAGGAGPAAISPQDGSFSAKDVAADRVAWTAATPGARWTTVVGVTPAPAGGSGTGAPRNGETPPAGTNPPAPAGSTPETASPTPPAQVPPAARPPSRCPGARWLAGTARRPRPAFVGMRGSDVRRCLGAPERRVRAGRSTVWQHAGGLALTLRGDRVVRVRVTGKRWRSAHGGLRVGAGHAAVRAALPRSAALGRRVRRAVLAVDGRQVADVRVALSRDGRRVASIDVRLTEAARLDAAGRRLLGTAP